MLFQVKGPFRLDVVVGERATVLELLAREDEALLVTGRCPPFPDLFLHRNAKDKCPTYPPPLALTRPYTLIPRTVKHLVS